MQTLDANPRDDIAVAYFARLGDAPPFDDDCSLWIQQIAAGELSAVMWNEN